jgi:hypothetical protein
VLALFFTEVPEDARNAYLEDTKEFINYMRTNCVMSHQLHRRITKDIKKAIRTTTLRTFGKASKSS